MIKTVCLFHGPGHLHDSCVIANKFGQVWLVRDMLTMFWVDQSAIDMATKFASVDGSVDDDDNYSAWCRATPESVSGFGGDGSGGIRDSGTAEFLAACREAEAKIEAAGGIQYAALVGK